MAKIAFKIGFEDSPILFSKVHTRTISGTVKNGSGQALKREVRLYRKEDFTFDITVEARKPYSTTISDEVTGAYSFTVNEGSKMQWVVVCVGREGENVLAYHHVKTVD